MTTGPQQRQYQRGKLVASGEPAKRGPWLEPGLVIRKAAYAPASCYLL